MVHAGSAHYKVKLLYIIESPKAKMFSVKAETPQPRWRCTISNWRVLCAPLHMATTHFKVSYQQSYTRASPVAAGGLTRLVGILMKVSYLVLARFVISAILLTRLHKICTNCVTCEAGRGNVIYNKDRVATVTGHIMKRAGFSLIVTFLYSLWGRNKQSP